MNSARGKWSRLETPSVERNPGQHTEIRGSRATMRDRFARHRNREGKGKGRGMIALRWTGSAAQAPRTVETFDSSGINRRTPIQFSVLRPCVWKGTKSCAGHERMDPPSRIERYSSMTLNSVRFLRPYECSSHTTAREWGAGKGDRNSRFLGGEAERNEARASQTKSSFLCSGVDSRTPNQQYFARPYVSGSYTTARED